MNRTDVGQDGKVVDARKKWVKPEAETVDARRAETNLGVGADGPFNCHS